MSDYQLIVIGAGPGGYTAALQAPGALLDMQSGYPPAAEAAGEHLVT